MSNDRIKRLSDLSLVRCALRAMQNIDNAMTHMGEAGGNAYGHGGALSFGWDMPTASVYFPRLTRLWYKLKAEAKERGLTNAAYERYRIGRRAKKNPGKIIYKLVG